jgi:thymidylate synthase (FAD)
MFPSHKGEDMTGGDDQKQVDSDYIPVLDHGYVILRNLAGPVRRPDEAFDAQDRDPANVARMSFDSSDVEGRTKGADLKLNEYLLRNGHNTPIEMVQCWFEMQLPVFVARQVIRHRTASVNEISGRYVQLENRFYIPDAEVVGVTSASNKQGRNINKEMWPLNRDNIEEYRAILRKTCSESYAKYEKFLGMGIPSELARCVLHLNVYTKWVWRQDLHNIFHLMSLRLHGHAQWESRQYAEAIHTLLARHLPDMVRLFDLYRRKKED